MKRWSLLVFLLALPLFGQTPADLSTRATLQSKILGEERALWIRLPNSYAQTTGRYPVFYMTDGDAQMVHTVATLRFLEQQGRIPEMIVVGVSNTDRTRDLTPSAAPLRRADGTEMRLPTAGGADKFLAFFEKELIPFVEANYRALPLRVFAGHSFGGLFAINALAQKPDLFKGVIAASPSLQWDDDLVLKRLAAAFEQRDALPVTVHVTAGHEGDPLVESVRRFETLARKAPKEFRASVAYHDDEDHGSIVLRTHYDGIRNVFAGWQPPRDQNGRFSLDLRQMEEHYAAMSKRFGIAIPPPEPIVNLLGYQYLAEEKFDEAIAVFRRNVEMWPESANVYDSLGEAHERRGDRDAARKLYEMAVKKSEGKNDPNEAAFKANLERLSKAE